MSKKKIFIINVITSLVSQAVVLILGLIIPRLVLKNYGSDTNGLTSTITQIFTYLALLEAGISQSAKNALYKPFKENNSHSISHITSLAKRTYRRISYIYLAAVIVMAVAIPFILKTDVDFWTIFVLVLFEGLTNIVSFYFISVWSTILFVDGKTYVSNLFELISKILCYTVKITLVLFSLNIALIQVGFFVVSLIKLAIYYSYFKKHYPWLKTEKISNDEKLPDRGAYIITEVAWTVFSSTDLILIGIFLSTKISSVYTVYNMVLVALVGILSALYNAVSYILGKTYVEDIEKYKRVHDLFNSFFMAIITVFVSVTYLLLIPFVKLYTNGITDTNYIYEWLPLLFCLVPLLSWSRYPAGNLSGIAGYAKQTSVVSLIEAIINIVLSLILVNFLGIYGVLLATVCALPLKVIYLNWLCEKKILHRNPLKTILILCSNYLIFGLTILFSSIYGEFVINSYGALIVYGVILTLIYLVLTLLINLIVNRDIIKFYKVIKFKHE